MRKFKKLAALALAVLLCVSLCGCQELEDMRAAQAFLQKDGTIRWNGNTYRQLENVPHGFQFFGDKRVMVTLPDVPVLLSEIYGENFSADKEGVILHSWHYGVEEGFFCREDCYEEVAAYLQQEVKMDGYCYTYWDEEGDLMYYLTDAQCAVVDHLITSLEFTNAGNNLVFEMDDYCFPLWKCDEKHLFLSDNYAVEIANQKGTYYLITSENTMSAVPTEYYSILDEIVKPFYEAEIVPYISAE